METLLEGVMGIGAEPGRLVMMIIGGVLMYLGIKKNMSQLYWYRWA